MWSVEKEYNEELRKQNELKQPDKYMTQSLVNKIEKSHEYVKTIKAIDRELSGEEHTLYFCNGYIAQSRIAEGFQPQARKFLEEYKQWLINEIKKL
jgi:hypothetical protein